MENEKENFHKGAICWSGKRKIKKKKDVMRLSGIVCGILLLKK